MVMMPHTNNPWTQEAQARRIMNHRQTWDPISKREKKKKRKTGNAAFNSSKSASEGRGRQSSMKLRPAWTGLQSEFQSSQGYKIRPCLKKINKQKPTHKYKGKYFILFYLYK